MCCRRGRINGSSWGILTNGDVGDGVFVTEKAATILVDIAPGVDDYEAAKACT